MTAGSDPQDHPSETLLAYVEDALDASERARVEAHLKACDKCRRDAEFMRLAAAHLALDGMAKRLEQGPLPGPAGARLPMDPDAMIDRARAQLDRGVAAWVRRRFAGWAERARAFATPVRVGGAVAVLAVALVAWELVPRGTGPAGRSVVASLPPVIEDTAILLRGGDPPADRDFVRVRVEEAVREMEIASLKDLGAAPWFDREPDAAAIHAMVASRAEDRFVIPMVRIDGPKRYRVSARVVDRAGAVLATSEESTVETPENLSHAVREAAERAMLAIPAE